MQEVPVFLLLNRAFCRSLLGIPAKVAKDKKVGHHRSTKESTMYKTFPSLSVLHKLVSYAQMTTLLHQIRLTACAYRTSKPSLTWQTYFHNSSHPLLFTGPRKLLPYPCSRKLDPNHPHTSLSLSLSHPVSPNLFGIVPSQRPEYP